MKISASTGPLRFSLLTPGTFTPTPVADNAHGIVTHPLHSAACSEVIGASEAPKSTVPSEIDLIPSPEPTAAYLPLVPPPLSKPEIQFAISGATRVDPAPVRPADANAGTARTRTPTRPRATPSNLLRVKSHPFDMPTPLGLGDHFSYRDCPTRRYIL